MKFNIHKTIAILLPVLVMGLMLFDYFTHTYIKATFDKTDPMPSKMEVYYKGYKLGKTSNLKVSKDFKRTYLYLVLNQRGLQLPKNIHVEVKNYDEDTKYVDIIYPTAPALEYIKSGDVIEGISELQGIDGISNTNQAHLDNLSEKGESLLASAKETTETMTELLSLIKDILSENRENLHASSSSLKNSMKNIESVSADFKELSGKMNGELSKETLQNTISNIETATKDFTEISENFNKIGTAMLSLTAKLNELIDVGKSTLYKLNSILSGLGETLRKRCGGMRVLFGVPIKE